MQFHSFTTSVVPNILIAVPSKKEKLPLSVTHPELASEVVEGDPNSVTSGSDKKLMWRCRFGHRWLAPVGSRALRGTGCPYCSGVKILIGFNDLATLYPEIAKQADGWNPSELSPGSHLSKKWKCNLGHTWQAKIQSRVNQNDKTEIGTRATGCPFCWGRRVWKGFNDLATTHPVLVGFLENKDDALAISKGSERKVYWVCHLGHRFAKNPVSIKGDDPGCPICHGVEVQVGFNDLKSRFPEIANELVEIDPISVTFGSSFKARWRCKLGHEWTARIGSRTFYNSQCPICSGVVILPGFNDFGTSNPDLAKELIGADPSKYGKASKVKVEWACKTGHSYTSTISDRATKGSGCPYCSGNKILRGFNDLTTTHPNIAAEAADWDPSSVIAGSGKPRKWICTEGHFWNASPQSRALKGTGCPTCSRSGFDPNEKGFLYFIKHEAWFMYQIGITNDPGRRLNSHKKLGWELLELRGPMDGHLTQQWETAILQMLKAKGADLSNEKIAGKFDGYSEAWSMSTFEVNSIKELMKMTEEFEGN